MENNIPNNSHVQCNDDEEMINWKTEAAAIIKDLEGHVNEIFVSETLPSNNFEIFINISTLEDDKYCIRASGNGFQIAGSDFDKMDELLDNEGVIYETPYALLSSISPQYIQSFANRLSQQLEQSLT